MLETPLLTFLVAVFAITTALLVFYVTRQRSRFALVDNLPEGVLMVSRSGEITWSNPAANKLLGGSGQTIIGRSIIDLLPGVEPLLVEHLSETSERVEVVLKDGTADNGYEVRATPSQNSQGETSGWLVTLVDQTLSRQVGKDLQRQKEQFEWLLSVARATTEELNIEETLQNVLDVTAELTSAEYGSLMLLDEAGVVTRGILALGKLIPGQEQITRRVVDKGLAGWVVRHRETALVEDTLLDERWLPSGASSYQARSALAVPIISQQIVVAVLTLTHSSPFHFNQEEAFLIEAAGEQMALAVRNAQLYDQQRALARRQSTLYEVLRTVGGHLDPEEVAKKATEIITKLTGWPAVAVLTPDGYETDLVVRAATGFLTEWIDAKVTIQNDVTGPVFQSGEYQYRPELSGKLQDGQWPHDAVSQLAVPLRRGDIVLGVLEVHSHSPHAMSEEDIRLAASLAEATALALDNARYHGAMRKHASDLNALYAVNRMIGRTLELDEMLSKSLYSALTSLGFGFGLIGLVSPQIEQLTLVSQRSVPVEILTQFENGVLEDSFAGFVYHNNRGIVIDDLERESPELNRLRKVMPDFVTLLQQLNVRSLVGVPLDHQRQSVGVLCMFSRQPHQYNASDMALQVTIGQQIGMAVSHSRLFSAVSEERSLLQAIINSSRDGIVMIGSNNKVLVVNQTALDFLIIQGNTDYWVNRPIMDALLYLRHRSPKLVRIFIDEVRQDDGVNNRSGSGEFEISSRSIRWQNLPVWSGNTFLGRLLVLNDRTDEKELNRVREDLVHTMVHDLRNPLTNILGSLEFLGDQVGPTLSEDLQQVMEIARTNTDHMVKMVSAILELSRLESGQMPLDQKPIFLPTLINNVVRTQSPLAMNKNIALNFEASSDLPLAWADGNLFERVLQNLLDNAIRFTPPNGEIDIEARLESAQSSWLLVSVSDSGSGIPEDMKERIFQKFTTARHVESGTGLGLAFCKMVVEAHGGRIWVENNDGQGTVFSFILPPLPATIERLKS
ncbi:MAG: GAF domain-containing protein [Candidatus Promineifilaceae bacterium]